LRPRLLFAREVFLSYPFLFTQYQKTKKKRNKKKTNAHESTANTTYGVTHGNCVQIECKKKKTINAIVRFRATKTRPSRDLSNRILDRRSGLKTPNTMMMMMMMMPPSPPRDSSSSWWNSVSVFSIVVRIVKYLKTMPDLVLFTSAFLQQT
jgi:hypothetical protein